MCVCGGAVLARPQSLLTESPPAGKWSRDMANGAKCQAGLSNGYVILTGSARSAPWDRVHHETVHVAYDGAIHIALTCPVLRCSWIAGNLFTPASATAAWSKLVPHEWWSSCQPPSPNHPLLDLYQGWKPPKWQHSAPSWDLPEKFKGSIYVAYQGPMVVPPLWHSVLGLSAEDNVTALSIKQGKWGSKFVDLAIACLSVCGCPFGSSLWSQGMC